MKIMILNELISDQYGTTKDIVIGYIPDGMSEDEIQEIAGGKECSCNNPCSVRVQEVAPISK